MKVFDEVNGLFMVWDKGFINNTRLNNIHEELQIYVNKNQQVLCKIFPR